MATISIEDASATELADFAKTYWGIETSLREGKAKILSKLADAGFVANTIETDDPKPIAPKATGKEDSSSEYATILIPKQNGQPRLQFVSVNGVAMWIERGVPSRVKKHYVTMLNDAVEEIYEASNDGLREPSYTPAIPFQVLAAG